MSSGASSASGNRIGQASASDPLSLGKDKAAPHLSDTSHVDLLGEAQSGFDLLGSKLQPEHRDDIFLDSDDDGAAGENVLTAPNRDMALSGHNVPSALPDFLSDGAALSASSLGLSSMTNSTHEDLLSQIQMVT